MQLHAITMQLHEIELHGIMQLHATELHDTMKLHATELHDIMQLQCNYMKLNCMILTINIKNYSKYNWY